MHLYDLQRWLKEKKHKRSPWGEKLDSNGYAKPLLDTQNGECYLSPYVGDTARHEIYGGADRQTSKATGMWVYLSPKFHELAHTNEKTAEHLHQVGQQEFEKIHSHEEFITLFGKNYL